MKRAATRARKSAAKKVGRPTRGLAKTSHKERKERPVRIYALNEEQHASGRVYLGIDAAKNSLALAVVRRTADDSVDVVLRRQIDNNETAITNFLKGFRKCKVTAVYEAGPTGYSLLRWLRRNKCEAFMTPPTHVPSASGNRVKTDKKDATKLATLLAGGQLKRIQDLTDVEYGDREMVRARRRAVNALSDIARQLKSLALFHGLVLEGADHGLSEVALRKIEALDIPNENLRQVVIGEVARYRAARQQVQRYTKAVGELAKEDRFAEGLKLIRRIPGMGVISGMEVLVEWGHDRFSSGARWASYTGLTPGEYSSGESTRRGRITKQGNAHLRATLVEAAWRWVYRDPTVLPWYQQLAKRRGGKKAIVAAARKLAVRLHAVLRNKIAYAPAP